MCATVGWVARFRQIHSLGPGVSLTGQSVELEAPGVSRIRSRGTTLKVGVGPSARSPRATSNLGGPNMPSKYIGEVLLQGN